MAFGTRLAIVLNGAKPSSFGTGDWSIAAGDEVADITITRLPASGGPSITRVEYRLDGGAWVSSGGKVGFTITGLTNDQGYDVELRAVNGTGNGAVSDLKTVTPEGAGGLPTVNHRYLRWCITGRRGGSGDSIVQVADLILRRGGSDIAWPIGTTVSNVFGEGFGGQEDEKLIDANSATKWCTGSGIPQFPVFDTQTSVEFDSYYYYVTADDANDRDPVDWALQVSDNGSDWADVDIRASQGGVVPTARTTATPIFELNAL